MNYIVDGYNLAFKDEELSRMIKAGDTEKVISLLVSRVKRVIKEKSTRIVIVFDGKEGFYPKSNYGRVEIKFSKKPQTADDIIRNFLRKIPNPKEWVVVTSDNEIIFTARDHGAQNIKSEQFLAEPVKKQRRAKKNSGSTLSAEKYNPSDVDVEFWLKQFNGDKKTE